VTLYEVTAAAGGQERQAPLVVADGGLLLGAQLIPGPGQGMGQAITAFTASAGPLYVRRHDYGHVNPRFDDGADIVHDIGQGRKSSIVIRPEAGWLPAYLDAYLRSCKQAGLVVDVTLWPEPHRVLSPQRYKVMCEVYVPVIHAAGFTHTFCVSNYAAVTEQALARYWPGDDLADQVAVTFYPSGLSLALAAAFAGDHGKPLGLAEFAPGPGHATRSDNLGFLRYITECFACRLDAGEPCGDLVWLSGGDYPITADPAYPEAYRHMRSRLVTRTEAPDGDRAVHGEPAAAPVDHREAAGEVGH
jgi:hypothetical protein